MTTTPVPPPDLSFTQDPQWHAERQKLWDEKVGKLFSDSSRSGQKEVYRFFMTGEEKKWHFTVMGASATFFQLYPMKTPEGWNYLFQYIRNTECDPSNSDFKAKSREAYLEELTPQLFMKDLSYLGWTPEEQASLWAYFIPERYQRSVRSPVPLLETGDYFDLPIPLHEVVVGFQGELLGIRRQYAEVNGRLIDRIDFFISALKAIRHEEVADQLATRQMKTKGPDVYTPLRFLFKYVNNPVEVLPEHRELEKQFRETLVRTMEENEWPAGVQQMWDEAKQQVRETH